MSFEKAENFLLLAAKKYKLERQARSALVCERARKIIQDFYPDFLKIWNIKKFEHGVLFISADDSAAKTELFLRTHEILEKWNTESFSDKIQEIRIVRK